MVREKKTPALRGGLLLLAEDADFDNERAVLVRAGLDEVERAERVGEREPVRDHALDAVELARVEERERGRVGACVPVQSLDVSEYDGSNCIITYQTTRLVAVVGAGLRWGDEKRKGIRTGTRPAGRLRDRPRQKAVVRRLGSPFR